MEIGEMCRPASRAEWRAWLEAHHASAIEIWLVSRKPAALAAVSYLDSVEEALCFGWIDGIGKSLGAEESAQRFTPRRPRSNWTELNKARARRLIALGLMTDAGRAVLPDLDAPFRLLPEVERALRADPGTWATFTSFPPLYQRVRAGYVQEMRGSVDEFATRLANLVTRTAQGQMFGNWNDGGRLDDE
ncbi:YdeI family protein [Luteitalea sp.]|jgi:hypothetical protein|uniref:YdeI family protein n=1 Tax=Luteitalea sp. TaxID=2004800 RepID=UPI0037C74D32